LVDRRRHPLTTPLHGLYALRFAPRFFQKLTGSVPVGADWRKFLANFGGIKSPRRRTDSQ
jgi:hypothetical protein